jgi:DNA-binding response OmpR family regulator
LLPLTKGSYPAVQFLSFEDLPSVIQIGSRGIGKRTTASTEFSLLEVLARYAGQPVSKDQLSEEGLGRPLSRYDRSIDVHRSSIRQKCGNLASGNSPIQTVIRKGYQLVVE